VSNWVRQLILPWQHQQGGSWAGEGAWKIILERGGREGRLGGRKITCKTSTSVPFELPGCSSSYSSGSSSRAASGAPRGMQREFHTSRDLVPPEMRFTTSSPSCWFTALPAIKMSSCRCWSKINERRSWILRDCKDGLSRKESGGG